MPRRKPKKAASKKTSGATTTAETESVQHEPNSNTEEDPNVALSSSQPPQSDVRTEPGPTEQSDSTPGTGSDAVAAGRSDSMGRTTQSSMADGSVGRNELGSPRELIYSDDSKSYVIAMCPTNHDQLWVMYRFQARPNLTSVSLKLFQANGRLLDILLGVKCCTDLVAVADDVTLSWCSGANSIQLIKSDGNLDTLDTETYLGCIVPSATNDKWYLQKFIYDTLHRVTVGNLVNDQTNSSELQPGASHPESAGEPPLGASDPESAGEPQHLGASDPESAGEQHLGASDPESAGEPHLGASDPESAGEPHHLGASDPESAGEPHLGASDPESAGEPQPLPYLKFPEKELVFLETPLNGTLVHVSAGGRYFAYVNMYSRIVTVYTQVSESLPFSKPHSAYTPHRGFPLDARFCQIAGRELLLVTVYNDNQVHIFDHERAKFVDYLDTQPLKLHRPRKLATDFDKHVWIGCWGGKVVVIDL